MKGKILFLAAAAMLFMSSSVYAGALGNETGNNITDMGANTYLHNVTFMSDQTGVGQQTEYYVEYTPNTDAVPVVVNGNTIWGTRTISQAAQYIEAKGFRPLIGINGDYFSFKTGIPMGYTIIDGEIASKENGTQPAIGFRSDGTGFIRDLNIVTTISDGERSIGVMYINKWCQPGFEPVYMLTDKFGSSSKTSSECIFVICSPAEGSLSVDTTMTATVEEVFVYNGEIAIPKGKIVLEMDIHGYAECYDFLSRLAPGQTLFIENKAVGDDEGIWKTAQNGISSVGGRLLANGNIGSGYEAGAAPRTAVGVKENGNIIFYVLDGRQTGYSYGAQIATIAKRMKELGCVDAINLDGGGSTAIAGVYPGSDVLTIINSPSDGEARSCANYIFLQDNRKPTGIPYKIDFMNIANRNFVSGSSTLIQIGSVYDTNNYKMEGIGKGHFEVVNGNGGKSYIDEDNVLHFEGNGTAQVNVVTDTETVYGDIFECFESPDKITLYDESNWQEIHNIYCEPYEEVSINIGAAAYVGDTELNSEDGAFEWFVEGDIGTIDNFGNFTLKPSEGVEGKIIVRKGDCSQDIGVHILTEGDDKFVDINGHWAENTINIMAAAGIINGIEEEGLLYFKPDNNMTRAEFAQMVTKYLSLDTEDYSEVQLEFADRNDIPLWAQNAVKAMYENNIIIGSSHDDGTVTFDPYNNITRAEAMTILGRLIEEDTDSIIEFTDSADIPLWAEEGISKLVSNKIVNGYNDNSIHPNDNIKRAESLSMLYKMINR